jgi:hypothetical protein
MNAGLLMVVICFAALAGLGFAISFGVYIVVAVFGGNTTITKKMMKFFGIVLGASLVGFLFAADK